MNKYYIGYSVPLEVEMLIKYICSSAVNLAVQDPRHLHVTALHIGPSTHEEATRIFHSMEPRTLPIPVEFDTYERFGDHVVITLKAPPDLEAIHNRFVIASKQVSKKRYKYNPHITIAHGAKGFIKIGCPEKKFYLNKINLYEKGPEFASEYRIIESRSLSPQDWHRSGISTNSF